MGNSKVVPQKLNTGLPYDPAIPLLVIYIKGLKAKYQTCLYTQSIVALFTINKKVKAIHVIHE